MRPTRTGVQVFLLLLLTLAAALASGNNLLYLLYGLLLSALLVSAAAALLGPKVLEVRFDVPEEVFEGSAFPLGVRVKNPGRFARRFLRLRIGGAQACLDRLEAGEERTLSLTLRLPHRGLNRLALSRLESAYPFGLLLHRTRLDAPAILALPRPGEPASRWEVVVESADTGAARPKKGAGDDLYGIRAYDESDDPRLINWKLSARAGKLLVNEFSEPGGSKILIRLAAERGPEAERLIGQAASACRYHIERGSEVRLLAGAADTGFGRGRLHLDRMLRALALLGDGALARDAEALDGGTGPQAPADATRPLAVLTYAGLALVWASLFLIEEVDRRFIAALLPVFAAGAWVDLRAGPRLPKWLWDAASLAMLAFILLLDWRVNGVVLSNTHLLIYLLANRALNAKDAVSLRQFFLILFLAFFLVSGQTISLWYLALFLPYAVFAGAWLALGLGGEGRAFGRSRGFWPAMAACLCCAALVFAATPRIEPLRRMNPFAAMGLDRRAPKGEFVVGFSERVSLGFFGHLKKSGARVLRIRPLDPAARPAPLLRVRGPAFDFFSGRAWSKERIDFRYRILGRSYWTAMGRAWLPRRGAMLLFPEAAAQEAAQGRASPPLEFTVYPLNSAVVFTAQGAGLPAYVQQADNGAYFDYTDSAYFGSPYVGGIRYAVRGAQGGGGHGAAALEGYDRILRTRFLQLPPFQPRVAELARRIVRRAAAPADKIAAVERYLRRGFAYSAYSEDADLSLEDFLFKTHSGNCEYFATAAAVLLREVGVPTRLVTGFLVNEWNEYGRFYDVRQGMAHAWVEAYSDGRWLVVEATPPEESFSQRTGAALAKLRRYFDALQSRWYAHVIGYDTFLQRNTFRRSALAFDLSALIRAGRRALPASASLLGAFLALALARGARRRARKDSSAYERAEALLSRSTCVRAPHQTPLEFLEAVSERRPDLARFRALAELHYALRYAGRPFSAAQGRRAEELLSDLRARLDSARSGKRP